MNVKWMMLIVIVLVVAILAINLFVPKKINLADGTIKIFGKDQDPATVDNPTKPVV